MRARFHFLQATIALLPAALAGCADSTNAIIRTAEYAFAKSTNVDNAILDAKFRYLRVTIDGRTTLLALGFLDPHPHGPIEVWYSGQKEALRLQSGRLAGVAGLPVEWRQVFLPPFPKWETLARTGKAHQWERVRDVMPGYRFGIRDALTLVSIPPPARSQLRDLEASDLAWFEERSASGPGDAAALPPARYAVYWIEGQEFVIYGEQCVTREYCFAWQRWPAGR